VRAVVSHSLAGAAVALAAARGLRLEKAVLDLSADHTPAEILDLFGTDQDFKGLWLPHVRIFSMYGLTECKRVSYLAPDEVESRPTSVGKPMDNVEVFVADENGNLSSTGVGELVVNDRYGCRYQRKQNRKTKTDGTM